MCHSRSKDIVKLERNKVRIVGDASLLNARSIIDLQDVRSIMAGNKIKVDDLHFLIGEHGRDVIADPLHVIVNEPPSKNNLRMINLLIKSTENHGSFK